MLKILLDDLFRGGLKFGVVIVAISSLWYLFSDVVSSEEKKRLASAEAISNSVKSLSASELVEEVGSVFVYTYLCGFEDDAINIHNALVSKNITFQDFQEDGAFRADYERGMERIATLILPDATQKYRDISCQLGFAAYGPNGTIIPGLLTE